MSTTNLQQTRPKSPESPALGTSRAKYQRDWRAKRAAAAAQERAMLATVSSSHIDTLAAKLDALADRQSEFEKNVMEMFGKMRMAFASLHADVKAIKEKMNTPKDGGAW